MKYLLSIVISFMLISLVSAKDIYSGSMIGLSLNKLINLDYDIIDVSEAYNGLMKIYTLRGWTENNPNDEIWVCTVEILNQDAMTKTNCYQP
tara:strand:- start:98 stop:373 length:276 start_codon:yes stop_codon:yes gene_type:complete